MAASHIKFEHSPADSLEDSFTSTPGNYSSLFDADDGLAGALTPPFDDNSSMFDQSISESTAGTPGPDKKQTKKRKSWGQQLPEPKTNLPPRKRAKTEDEKEQRRVERVLRNRRAAQSSRERKRMEVEALEAEKETIERKYRDLEMRLEHSLAQNAALQQQIAQITGGNPSAFKTAASSPAAHVAEAYCQASPLTLSQELFSSGHHKSIPTISEAHASLQQSLQTVNPASLSPEATAEEEPSNADSIDMTQHPAAMLCDLPCQSMEHKPWMASSPEQSLTSLMTLFLSLISLTASSTILPQLMTIMNSLTTNCPISPTRSLLTTIMWLTTTPACLSTLMTSSTTRSTTPPTRSKRFSLRMNLLRRLLACSPQLARPLMDATMGAMRLLASEQQVHARDCLDGGVSAGVDDGSSTRNVSPGVSPPSVECLMTLLWATKVIDRQNRQDQLLLSSPSSSERNSTKPGIGRARISELDELFRHRSVRVDGMSAGISFGGIGSGKSVDMEDGWRKAF